MCTHRKDKIVKQELARDLVIGEKKIEQCVLKIV